MTRLLFACLCLFSTALSAEAFKPYHVNSLSGRATLTRYEDEVWPLEPGQDLPGDLSLSLESGALLSLTVNRRVDLLIAGPAKLNFYSLERPEGEQIQRELLLRVESGSYYVDPRFLLGRPSEITLDLPERSIEVKSGLPFMVKADPNSKPQTWPAAFLAAAQEPVPVLVLCRDFDKERQAWPRPAVLGPALVQALAGLQGLRLVDGSGSTALAYRANHAIRSGQDFFVQDLARQRQAKLCLVGNLVVEELREESPSLRRNPMMSAVAEFRILEAFDGGNVLVSDVASTLCARAGRSLEDAGREALLGAAARAARYLSADFEELLKGQAHTAKLLKVVFNGVDSRSQRELRRALSDLDSVQRFFKRSFASGVFRMDVVLRKSEEDFLRQLAACQFQGFKLEENAAPPEGGRVFTLRPVRLDKALDPL